jgi:predicted dehydrogenase
MSLGKLRLGIVGGGGAALISGLRSVAGVEVVALCEADPARLEAGAREHGIPQTYDRYEAMLDAVDAVVIATPMPLHVPQSVLALQAGKHVLSEVTAAVTLAECWGLLDAVRAASTTYMLAENICFTAENVLIREMARRGLFGDLYFGEGEYLHEVRTLHHQADGSPTWRYHWQVGVDGCTYSTHSLGPVMHWFRAADPEERVETVVCLGSGRHTDPEHLHSDTCLMLCQLRSGKLIKIREDMLSNRPYGLNFTLQGTQGVYESARFQGAGGHLWIGANRAGERREWRPVTEFAEFLPAAWREPAAEAHASGHGGGDFHTGRLFAEAALTGGPASIDVYEALEWTATGLCSQLSIANGGLPIRIPEFRDPNQRPLVCNPDAGPVL